MLREFHLGIAKRGVVVSRYLAPPVCAGFYYGLHVSPAGFPRRGADDYDQRDGRNVPVTAGSPGREEGDSMACGELFC